MKAIGLWVMASTALVLACGSSGEDGDDDSYTVTLASGFTPDPRTVEGVSGGSVDAATLGGDCLGYISEAPNHLFVASDAFAKLRIMAASSSDVTLVVQKPDGSYLCNDDFEGTNPLLEGAFPAGSYKIWVGSYEQGSSSPYRLGFSELSGVTPARLEESASTGTVRRTSSVRRRRSSVRRRTSSRSSSRSRPRSRRRRR